MTIPVKPISSTDITAEREKWAQLKLQKAMRVERKPDVHNISVSRESFSGADSEVGKKQKKLKKDRKVKGDGKIKKEKKEKKEKKKSKNKKGAN